MSFKQYGWTIAYTNQDSTFCHTRENSKVFNITSKYFSFFNNKPPASWVAHTTRDFLTCHSCSMVQQIFWHAKKLGLLRVLFMTQSYSWLKFLVVFVIMISSSSSVSLTKKIERIIRMFWFERGVQKFSVPAIKCSSC